MSKDSDIALLFKAQREDRKKRNARRRDTVPSALRDAGVQFDAKNCGAHLIINHGTRVIDFWPGTGLWKERNGRCGRGFVPLMKHIKATTP